MNFQRVSAYRSASRLQPQELHVASLSPRTARRTLPAPERMFLLLAVMISGTVTVPMVIDAGGISGSGMWTIAAAGISWGLWLMRPRAPMALMPVLIPLAAFTLFACISPFWGGGFDGAANAIQLLAVTVAFVGLIILTARETASRPYFAESVGNALDFASVTAAVLYTITFLIYGPGGEMTVGGRPVFLARPFALFAIIAVARQLGRFHAGEKGGLVIAVWLAVLVFLSQSRLGMVTIIALFPLSYLLLGGRRNITMAVFMLAFGAGTLTVLLMTSDALHSRFFGEDASIEVGGVAINASGRTAAWTAMIDDIRGPMRLWFGAGSGAGSRFTQSNFHNLPHPHNDYLRYLFDFGLFGLIWFLVFMVCCFAMLWRRVRAARLQHDRVAFGIQFGTLLALAGIAVSMFTDNSANYIYIMAPLGVLLGATLCREVPRLAEDQQNVDWVFQRGHRRPVTRARPSKVASTHR